MRQPLFQVHIAAYPHSRCNLNARALTLYIIYMRQHHIISGDNYFHYFFMIQLKVNTFTDNLHVYDHARLGWNNSKSTRTYCSVLASFIFELCFTNYLTHEKSHTFDANCFEWILDGMKFTLPIWPPAALTNVHISYAIALGCEHLYGKFACFIIRVDQPLYRICSLYEYMRACASCI